MLNYVLTGEQFDLPDGVGLFESCPDGRLVLVGVDQLMLEDLPGSRTFTSIDSPAFGAPSFFRISPSGAKAAAGNYQQNTIYFFSFPFTSGGPVLEVDATSYDAEWLDETWLGTSRQGSDGVGAPSVVSMVRSTDGEVREVISNIPGASGGVTFDSDSNLYTGNGYAGPNNPATGLIKAFPKNLPGPDPNEWGSIIQDDGGAPLDFTMTGREAANLLSAAFLTFDDEDNLCIGGGWGVGPGGHPDAGYAAVVSHNAIRGALFDHPPIQPGAATHLLQVLDPIPLANDEHWIVNTNLHRQEVYVKRYTEQTVYVYRQNLNRHVISTNFHLGDTPSAYPGSTYVGMVLNVPVPLPNPATFSGPLCVRLRTRDIQSLRDALGNPISRHQLLLGGHNIGQLTSGFYVESKETFDFLVPRALVVHLRSISIYTNLQLEVSTAPGSGLADDFLVTEIGLITIPV